MKPDFRKAFWSFNVGHLITITLLLISVVGLYFKVDSRLTAVELLASRTSEKLERVDEQGTRRSQLGISQETELIRSHGNRITELEKAVSALTPKIERMDTNIQWIVNQQQNMRNSQFFEPQQDRHTRR